MKILIASIFAFLALGVADAQQYTLTQTTITAAQSATQNYAVVASGTNIANNRVLYIDNEMETIKATYTTGLNIPVTRDGNKKSVHASGAMVLVGRPNWFATYDPYGGCTLANTLAMPWVTALTGNQWLCSSVLNKWVPGFQNDIQAPQVTAAVASAATLITPSGPLFHVTGALAITGFTIPVGFSYGSFTIIPDGAFTTTTANNIAIASTAVVSKALTFTYDANLSKFFPSY